MYQTISDMVASSNNGKVSIVAHSNGGLLAKVFMGALEEADDPLLDKIENVILVASPQVGTPEALVGLLHGSEIGNGFVVDQVTSRRLLNTAPFGHHLLPNLDYFDSEGVEVFAPVITFNNGTATDGWVNDFGKEITDVDEMYEFLSKDSGREKPATTDLLHPEAVDNYLIDYADTMSDVLVSWDPGPRTRVYQIAGTGIETPSGITYFTDKECVRGGLLWFDCTEYLPKLGYYPNFTFDGDGTVVVPSALAMGETDGIERVWLDLSSPDLNKQHKDIFEVTQLIDFISEIILSTSTPDTPRFISRNEVVPDIGERLSFYLHSPLDMYLESSAGITSSSSSDIPGATYRRYGEVQYVSVPKDTASLTLKLKGYQTGSFTLVVQEWNGDTLVSTRDYESLPTENSTIVQLPLEAFSVNTKLKIDIDGDGVFDGEVSTEESAVNLIEVEKTEETISSPSNTSTRVATAPVGQVAGITVSAEEQWYYGEIEKILKEVAKLITLIEQQHEK